MTRNSKSKMGRLHIWLLFLLICCVAVFASKYSENKNVKKSKITDETPFRMNKINLFWEKASKVSDVIMALMCNGMAMGAGLA